MKKYLFFGCAAILTTSCATATPTTRINPGTCTAVPPSFNKVGRDAIGINWRHYRPFMKLCPVRDASGKTALHVLALVVPAAQKAGDLEWVDGKRWTPDSTQNSDPVPLPIAFDRQNRKVAVLPKNIFPLLPDRGNIVFTNWRNGIPDTIIVSKEFHNLPPNSALQCLPPFLWNAQKRLYQQVNHPVYGACSSKN
ncbi:MAG: hypothetical protein ACYCZB_10475 [Acidiphilium sp.]